jgi:hypothetical protein
MGPARPTAVDATVRERTFFETSRIGVHTSAYLRAGTISSPVNLDSFISLPSRHPAPMPSRSSRWAALLARIYEVFPLVCPTCGTALTFIAFLTDPEPIAQDDFDRSWGA